MKVGTLFPALTGVLCVAVLASACRDEATCLRHTDCARGESCSQGLCVSKPTPGRADDDAGEGGELPRAGAANGGTSRGGTAGGPSEGGNAAGSAPLAGRGGSGGSGGTPSPDAGAAGDG